MRKLGFISLALGISVGVAMVGIVSGQAQDKVKAGESVHVYNDPSYAAEHGAVEFSHAEHKAVFGQEKLDCKPCHMTKPPLFSMKKPEPGETRPVKKMADMVAGQSCGGCHNGKTVINGKTASSVSAEDGCGHCHKKGG